MSVGHVGTAIARSLELHDVPRIFEVPGESFLPVLDGLYESSIDTIVCRQEGGACYMAEAHGKATGQPGVAMVTRGPGAANAFVGIHTAWQDATPVVLFVGLVPTSDRDRESFQEFDIKAWFGTQAKRVYVLDDASRASRVVAEAFHLAAQGRPGPVVIGLPEDVLHQEFTGDLCQPLPASHGAFSDADLDFLADELRAAQKPLILPAAPTGARTPAQPYKNSLRFSRSRWYTIGAPATASRSPRPRMPAGWATAATMQPPRC